ncbi:MAG: Rz1-like lysis system protein LysC [Bradymonadia bacterium]
MSLASGLIALSLSLFQACSTAPQVRTEFVRTSPPKALLTPCEYPSFTLKTNRDFVTALSLVIEAYSTCEAKMDALIELFKEVE